MTMLCCVSGNIKADENTSMWVGDSYAISVPTFFESAGSTYNARSYEYSYDAGYFIMQQDQESENKATFTLKNPFIGTKTITCTVDYYYYTIKKTREYKFNITCNQVNVSLYPTEMALGIGETSTLQWQFSHTTTPAPEITFSSSDNSIADVDFNGKITAKKPGTATITATTDYGTTATCEVTVLGLALDKAEAEMHVGEQLKLTASILPTEATQRVTWSSSDPAVARVVGGTVYALDWGECVITAKSVDNSNLTADCLIYVLPEQQVNSTDVNGDGKTDVSDVNVVINAILKVN